jgi:hypothetical protein
MLSYYWEQQGRRMWKDDEEFQRHLEEMHKYEAMFWEMSPDKDPIMPRVDAVISDIEAQSFRIIEQQTTSQRIRRWFIRPKQS